MRTKIIALLLASGGPGHHGSAPARARPDTKSEQAAAANKSGIDLAAMDKGVKPGDDFFPTPTATGSRTAKSPPTAARSALSMSRSRSWRSGWTG